MNVLEFLILSMGVSLFIIACSLACVAYSICKDD